MPRNLTKYLETFSTLKNQGTTIRGRLARAAVWGLSASVCSRVLGLITSVAAARILGRSAFGHYGMVISTANFFSVYASLGMGLTATKYVSQYRTSDPQRAIRLLATSFWLALVTSTLLGATLYIGAGSVASRALGAPGMAPLLRRGALIVFLTGINGVQVGALSGFEAFPRIASTNLISGLTGLPISVTLTLFYGVQGMLLGTILTLALAVILNACQLRIIAKGMYSLGTTRNWKEVLGFGVPVLLSALVAGPAGWVTNTILVKQPGGFSAMGIVGVAEQWKQIINYIPLTLASSFVPVLSSLRHESRAKIWRVAAYQSASAGGFAALIAIPVAIGAPAVLRMYGKDYRSGTTVLIIISLSTILIAIANATSLGLQALGWPWLEASAYGIWGIALVISSAILIPRFGAIGYAEAVFSAITIQVVWQILLILGIFRQKRRTEMLKAAA